MSRNYIFCIRYFSRISRYYHIFILTKGSYHYKPSCNWWWLFPGFRHTVNNDLKLPQRMIYRTKPWFACLDFFQSLVSLCIYFTCISPMHFSHVISHVSRKGCTPECSSGQIICAWWSFLSSYKNGFEKRSVICCKDWLCHTFTLTHIQLSFPIYLAGIRNVSS